MIGDWMGPRARLVTFGWSNRGRAVPGDTLTCTGRVVGKRDDGGRHVVDLEVVETNQRGEVCAPGKATVALPSRETAR
jgi:acyl-coenzyme A thioesterase PaaI-like protein